MDSESSAMQPAASNSLSLRTATTPSNPQPPSSSNQISPNDKELHPQRSETPLSSPKEVRFSDALKVIVCSPTYHGSGTSRVSFSDNISYIDTRSKDPPADNKTTTKKHVRFGCIKQPKQPLSRGAALLHVLRRQTLVPLPGFSPSGRHIGFPTSSSNWLGSSSRQGRKRVRFGALKCREVQRRQGDDNAAIDLLGVKARDEAETRLAFKRECIRHKALLPLSPVDDRAEGYDWGST